MTAVSRRPPPDRGERDPAAVAREGDTRSSWRARRGATSGVRCRCAVALLTPSTRTPYVHRSPVRHLALPDRRRRRGARPRLDLLDGHRVRRRGLLVGGAPARGRPRRDRRPARRAGRPPTRSPRAAAPARACTSTAAARSPCTTARSTSATTTTSASTGWHTASRSRSRRRGGTLRRPAGDAGRPLAGVRARARRRARARQRPRRASHRRLGGAARDRLRPRLLLGAADLARRHADRLAGLGPPADAVGGDASSTSTGGSSPAARPRRSSSRSGAPTASCTTAPTAPAGGTCTARTERR